MALLGKVLNQFKAPLVEDWVLSFNELEKTPEFPMSLALRALEEVEEAAQGDEGELRRCLLEDVIFNTISSYFYEDLIKTIGENPDVSNELLENFSERTEEMDEEVARETSTHSAFIENENHCGGCDYCDRHKEFAHLIATWVREDTDNLISEYLKAKTLHFAFEQIVFDVLPTQAERLETVSAKDVELFKHHIRSFIDRKLSTV